MNYLLTLKYNLAYFEVAVLRACFTCDAFLWPERQTASTASGSNSGSKDKQVTYIDWGTDCKIGFGKGQHYQC